MTHRFRRASSRAISKARRAEQVALGSGRALDPKPVAVAVVVVVVVVVVAAAVVVVVNMPAKVWQAPLDLAQPPPGERLTPPGDRQLEWQRPA